MLPTRVTVSLRASAAGTHLDRDERSQAGIIQWVVATKPGDR
jgi:hypothetical protein